MSKTKQSKSPKLLKVVVDRREWFRGRGGDFSNLLTISGRMCCIGFACLAAGIPKNRIRNEPVVGTISPWFDGPDREVPFKDPDRITIEVEGLSEILWNGKAKTQFTAYEINDSEELTDAEREEVLIKLGPQLGLEFEFIN